MTYIVNPNPERINSVTTLYSYIHADVVFPVGNNKCDDTSVYISEAGTSVTSTILKDYKQ